MEKKYVRNGVVGIIAVFMFYLFSTTPAYFYVFGLDENDTCDEFRKAPMKAQIKFLMGCGCLTEDLQGKLIKYSLDDRVDDCFYEKLRTCLGMERIGDMYRNCVMETSPY